MSTIEAQEIGRLFKEAREKKGLSIEEANRRSRIHMNVIDDIENGIFNRLGELYVRSFLRKYAEFLNLDKESILEKYEAIGAGYTTQEFDIGFEKDQKAKKENKKFPTIAINQKMIQGALIGVLALVLVGLVVVLVGRIRAKISSSGQSETAMAARGEKAAAPVIARKPAPPVPPKKEKVKAPRSSQVKLELMARGEVWVKVMKGDETLFVGVLRKGRTKSWTSDKPLTVWTGRGEMLDFTVNNQKVGRVADGVVKNIKVSSAGITINDNWVTRF